MIAASLRHNDERYVSLKVYCTYRWNEHSQPPNKLYAYASWYPGIVSL